MTHKSSEGFRAIGRIGPALALALALTTPTPAPAGSRIEIAPHRAIYDMSLASVRSGSTVANVRGKMLFAWTDACDGWTIEQRFQLDFAYNEGDQVNMVTNYVTWEAKDGRSYRFNVRKLVNGEVDEDLRGDARLNADGAGAAHYQRPEALELALPKGTMFPTAHTMALLAAAVEGQKVFSRTVFDGSDTEGITEINAAVGLPVEGKPMAAQPAALVEGRVWPVRLAFFPPSSSAAAPEYEMRMELLENGVARAMTIDYEDFTVAAKLERIEAVARPGC